MRTLWLLPLALLLAGCPGEPMTDPMDLSQKDALPAGACAAELSCRMGICLAPGGFAGCGACRMPEPASRCSMDDDCKRLGADLICSSEPRDCFCSPATICRPGCKKDSCGLGEACGTDLRCAGKPCTMDGDCPTHFVCSGSKRCERERCRTSAECTGGYCVGGACHGAPGSCTPPPP